MKNLKHSYRIIILIVTAILSGLLVGLIYQKYLTTENDMQQTGYEKLLYTMELLEHKYVDSINKDSIAEMLIPKLLHTLDPHSEYIPEKNVDAVNEQLTGKFEGVGIMFNMFTDTIIISNVISGGPSFDAGIIPGDRIITINDSIVAGKKMPTNDVIKMLRGERGTKVMLGVERNRDTMLIPFKVIRDEIPMHSITSAFMIEPTIGYINISRFATTTYSEFKTAIDKLMKQGLQKLIVDLRGNGGGLLGQAIYLANEFLPKGAGIVYTEGRSHLRKEQQANGYGTLQEIPLVVLLDSESASASEIFAGAMQDNDRATIIGLRSFGKGLIQEQIDYPDGSAVRITVAHYYTPIGRSIQKPYNNINREEYQLEVYKRYEHNELTNKDSSKVDTTQKFITPKGRVLYGGGGIHPDIFVSIDTTKLSPYFKKILQKNLIFRYSNIYTEEHRSKLSKINSFEQLDKLYRNTYLLKSFVKWADKQGVKLPTNQELNESEKYILAQIQSYVGRNTKLEENAHYNYMKQIDNTLRKSIEYIKNR